MESFAPAPPPRPASPPPLPLPPKYSSGLSTISTTSVRTLSSSIVEISSCKSLLVIACFIVVCFVASVIIFLLIRFLSGRLRRHRRSFSSVAAFPLSPSHLRSSSNVSDSSAVTAGAEAGAAALSEEEKLALIDSLPLISTASLSVLPKSSPDCAVCLSTFLPDDDLRLLPVCRHAFHATCIDNWLLVRDNPSCPLCRASITIHHPPFLPSALPLIASSGVISTDTLISSVPVEMGSVSLRRALPSGDPAKPGPARTYSIDSGYDYVVEEEVETVVAGIPRPTEKQPETGAPTSPAAQLTGAPSGRSSRWLKDYIDRLSSASSSFSSLRVSGRWSHRYDSGGDAAVRRLPSWHREPSGGREAADLGMASTGGC